MRNVQLSPEELSTVLARAEEIQRQTAPKSESGVSAESMLEAAVEAGLSRVAVEQALLERLDFRAEPPKAGELVFAKSADGFYWVAMVLAADENGATVEFLNAGSMQAPLSDIMPCTFLPGQRVACQWKDWGWWNSVVISYNPRTGKIRASDGWGSEEEFDISKVRLSPPKPVEAGSEFVAKLNLGLIAASALGGGVVGAAITWLFMH